MRERHRERECACEEERLRERDCKRKCERERVWEKILGKSIPPTLC